jgi:methionine--tRNA ligase beta chain
MITFEEFSKLDIRMGTITVAEKVSGADKLLRLEVDLGTETRQVVAGLAPYYAAQDVVGKKTPILVNLQPRKVRGVESHGMLLAVDVGGKPIMLIPDEDVPAGSTVR